MADLPNTMAMDDDPIDWSNNSNTNNTNTNNTIYGYLIRIDTHGEHGTPFILTKPTTTIGRHSNNDIILSASTISSFHAEIEINIPSGYAYLTDLNSTNNTRIGPQLPTIRYSNPSKKANRECIVQSGDYVTFGDIHFIFYHEQDYNSQISQSNVLNNILPTTQTFDEGEIDLKLSQFDDEASPKKVQFDMNNNNNNNDNKHDLEPTLVWDDDDDDDDNNDDQDNNLPATVAFGDDNDNDELMNTIAFDDELDVNNNGLNDSGFKSDKNNESGLGISTGNNGNDNNGGLAATMTIDDCYFGEGDNGKEELDATAKEDNDDNEDMLLATVTMDNDEETEDEEDVNHLPQTVVIDDGDEDSEQTLGVLSGSSNDNNEEIVATMVMGNDNDNEDIDLKGVNNNGDIDLKGVNNNEEHVDNGNTFQSEKTQMNDIFNDMDKEEPTLTMKIDTEDIDLNETNDTFTNDNKHKQELELDNNNNNNNDNHSVDLVNTVVEENNNDNNDNNNEFATTMVIDDDNDDSDNNDNNNNNDNDNHSVDLVNTAVEENNNDNNNEFAATMAIDDDNDNNNNNDNDNDSVDLVNTVVEENNNDSVDLVNTVFEENENNNDSMDMDMDIDENNNKQELGSDTEDEELKDNDNNIDTCINTFQSEIPQIDNTNTLHINKQNNNNNNNNIENMVATIKIDTQDIDFDDTNNTNNTNIQSEPLQSEQNEMDEEKEIIASKPIIKPNPPKRRRSARIANKSQSMDIYDNNDIQMESKSKSKSKVKQTNKKRGRKRTVSERDMDENTNPNSNNSISEPPNKKPRRSRRLSSNKNKTKSPTRSASRSASRKSKRLKYNKSNSQSKNDKQIVILWTGPDAKDLQPKLKQLGAKVLKDYNDSVTHLVTTQPRRTKKFLSGMGQTEYIVTETWASQCVRKKTLLIDENKYFPKNKATRDFEGKYGFKLTKSFKKLNERNDGLFTGYKIYFTKDFKKDNKKAIGIMVKSHNGILSSARLPTNVDENIIVIGQNINYKQCKDIKKKGYVVYNKDIIVISILRQEIDFDDDQFILKKN